MIKIAINKWIIASVVASTLVYSHSLYAFSFGKNWHPIGALSLGVSTVSLGESQNFPIRNPETDEFYRYAANSSNQSSWLGDVFLGLEKHCYPWYWQVGIGYSQASSFTGTGSTFVQGADQLSANTYRYQYSVISRQFLLETKLLYSIKESYHPFIFLGVGASFNDAYNFKTNVPPFLTFTRHYGKNIDTSFSYALGLGIDVDVNRCVRAGLSYRFVDLGRVKFGDATIDNQPVVGTISQSNFYANEVLATLTYRY